MTEASDGERCGGIKMLGAGREPEYGTSLPHQYSLMAGQGVPDCADGVAVLGVNGGGAVRCIVSRWRLAHRRRMRRSRTETTARPSSSVSRYRTFPYAAGDWISNLQRIDQRSLAPSTNSRPISNTAADRPDFTASAFCPSTNQ